MSLKPHMLLLSSKAKAGKWAQVISMIRLQRVHFLYVTADVRAHRSIDCRTSQIRLMHSKFHEYSKSYYRRGGKPTTANKKSWRCRDVDACQEHGRRPVYVRAVTVDLSKLLLQ